MVKKGFEERQLTPEELDLLVRKVERGYKPNLADVLRTHRSAVEKKGVVALGSKMWQEIDDAKDLGEQVAVAEYESGADLVEELTGIGMNVTVIDEDGVHNGRLMPDDSIQVNKINEPPDAAEERAALARQAAAIEKEKRELAEYPDNPEGMSDDETMDLDRKMDVITHPDAMWSDDGKTVFVPDEVLAELDPDKELDERAFPLCGCGCGGRTKGGRFIPGHDAKLKSRLMQTVFYGTSLTDGEQTELAEAAQLELNLRGWMKFYPAYAKNEKKRERRRGTVKCRICGRPLSDEESVEAGIGPVCAGRH